MLELNKVIKKYANQTVLGPLQLKVSEGVLLGVLGPNSSGKSTLLRLIAGCSKPTSGIILWNNQKLNEESNKDIAFLPDMNPFPPWMTIQDAIQFSSYFYPDFDHNYCIEHCQNFNLPLKKRISHLSKGDQEKVKLLMVLARKAKLFLLDEPFEGMDVATRSKALQLLADIPNEKCSLIISSHFINEMDQIFTDVLFLKDGKIALYRDKDSILAEMGLSLEDIYRDIYSEENIDASVTSV